MINLFSGKILDWSEVEQYETGKAPNTALDMALLNFQNLEDSELDYYGADTGDNTFKVDGIVFKVLEDPDDGYRSHLGAIDYTDKHDSIFFHTPVARVKITVYDERVEDGYGQLNHGYRLVDIKDGHVWLEFGTHNYDDYYPCFIFRHFPKGH